jgi:O-antigen/teichoic acid export membrane protein
MFGMWVITYLVVIISGATDAGLLALAMSATNVCYTIAIWGMRTYQVSDLKGKFSDNTYIMSRLLTCVVAVAACVFFVFAKSYAFEQRYCIILYMIFKISEAVVDVFNGIVQKHWRLDIIGRSSIARAILTVTAFSLTLKFTGSLLLSIVSMMVGAFAVILFYDIVQTVKIAHIKIKLQFQSIDKLLLKCTPLVICTFLYSFNALFPRMILEEKFGPAILGYYSAIASPVLVIQLLASFIFAPLIPLFSKSHTEHNTRAFSRLLLKTILVVLALSVVSLIGGYLLGDWGLSLLFSARKSVLDYSYLLIPTILTVICTAFIWLLNSVITAIRLIKYLFFSAIAGSVVCIAISKICIDAYGINGVNFSMIIVQAVQIILMLFFVLQYIRKGNMNRINN